MYKLYSITCTFKIGLKNFKAQSSDNWNGHIVKSLCLMLSSFLKVNATIPVKHLVETIIFTDQWLQIANVHIRVHVHVPIYRENFESLNLSLENVVRYGVIL